MSRASTPVLSLVALAMVLWPAPAPADPPPGPTLLAPDRIGLHVQPMTPALRGYFRAPADRGLLVAEVEPGGAAARAGLRVGDVILEAGGEPQRRPYDLIRAVGRAPEGEKLPVRIVRQGEARMLAVVPEGRAVPWPDPGAWADRLERGLRMGSEELRQQLRTLEQRLEELERRIEEERAIREGAERT